MTSGVEGESIAQINTRIATTSNGKGIATVAKPPAIPRIAKRKTSEARLDIWNMSCGFGKYRAEVPNCPLKTFFQLNLRLPIQNCSGARGIGLSRLRIAFDS